jgi:hypothetical protein
MFDEGENVVTVALNGAEETEEKEATGRRRRMYSIDSYNGYTTLRQWTGETSCSSLRGVSEGVLYPKYVTDMESGLRDRNQREREQLGFQIGPPLLSGGQSSWLQIHGSRIRFPALPHFLRSSGSGMGSIRPREYN